MVPLVRAALFANDNFAKYRALRPPRFRASALAGLDGRAQASAPTGYCLRCGESAPPRPVLIRRFVPSRPNRGTMHMEGTIDPDRDYVSQIAEAQYKEIRDSRERANRLLDELQEALTEVNSDDYDVVVFGSIARREWTSHSDVDWTLLVDSQSSPEHQRTFDRVREVIGKATFEGKSLKEPGREGVFASIAFSHQIIHHIGGQLDSNRNTTQRILLLTESLPLRANPVAGVGAHARVVRHVLDRYLADDVARLLRDRSPTWVPRFLLNDIVRYWRTLCVDFAYKRWEQFDSPKWAERNIKLRMSRKVLFVSALLVVFSCYQNLELVPGPGSSLEDCDSTIKSHLLPFVRSTPWDIIVWSMQRLKQGEQCHGLLRLYEEFLGHMGNDDVRNRLNDLRFDTAYRDPEFNRLCEISHAFQKQLADLFLGDTAHSDLRAFMCAYGVF